MPGNPTVGGYLKSFKYDIISPSNRFAPPSSGQAFRVPAEHVSWPPGWGFDGFLKGLFGQRRYLPRTP